MPNLDIDQTHRQSQDSIKISKNERDIKLIAQIEDILPQKEAKDLTPIEKVVTNAIATLKRYHESEEKSPEIINELIEVTIELEKTRLGKEYQHYEYRKRVNGAPSAEVTLLDYLNPLADTLQSTEELDYYPAVNINREAGLRFIMEYEIPPETKTLRDLVSRMNETAVDIYGKPLTVAAELIDTLEELTDRNQIKNRIQEIIIILQTVPDSPNIFVDSIPDDIENILAFYYSRTNDTPLDKKVEDLKNVKSPGQLLRVIEQDLLTLYEKTTGIPGQELLDDITREFERSAGVFAAHLEETLSNNPDTTDPNELFTTIVGKRLLPINQESFWRGVINEISIKRKSLKRLQSLTSDEIIQGISTSQVPLEGAVSAKVTPDYIEIQVDSYEDIKRMMGMDKTPGGLQTTVRLNNEFVPVIFIPSEKLATPERIKYVREHETGHLIQNFLNSYLKQYWLQKYNGKLNFEVSLRDTKNLLYSQDQFDAMGQKPGAQSNILRFVENDFTLLANHYLLFLGANEITTDFRTTGEFPYVDQILAGMELSIQQAPTGPHAHYTYLEQQLLNDGYNDQIAEPIKDIFERVRREYYQTIVEQTFQTKLVYEQVTRLFPVDLSEKQDQVKAYILHLRHTTADILRRTPLPYWQTEMYKSFEPLLLAKTDISRIELMFLDYRQAHKISFQSPESKIFDRYIKELSEKVFDTILSSYQGISILDLGRMVKKITEEEIEKLKDSENIKQLLDSNRNTAQ